MPRTAADHLTNAAAMLERGFTSKAGQKAALGEVNRALDCFKSQARDRILDEAAKRFPGARDDAAEWDRRTDWVNAEGYWTLPDYPHLIRDAHLPLFGDAAHEAADCREMRQLILAAPIQKVERDTAETERTAKVRETIIDLMERRGRQYDRALHLAELFGGLPVSANVHVAVNQHGTRYVRAFYYLRGEFTPLNVILAAADQLERERGRA